MLFDFVGLLPFYLFFSKAHSGGWYPSKCEAKLVEVWEHLSIMELPLSPFFFFFHFPATFIKFDREDKINLAPDLVARQIASSSMCGLDQAGVFRRS